MTSLTCETLGGDEQSGGAPFIRMFYPTDYEVAVQAMTDYINGRYTFGERFKALGLLHGWHLKKVVNLYIDRSYSTNTTLTDTNIQQWFNYYVQKGYSPEVSKIYVDSLLKLGVTNKFPSSIYNAYTYRPTEQELKETFGSKAIKKTAEVTEGMFGKILLYTVAGVVVYGVVITVVKRKVVRKAIRKK